MFTPPAPGTFSGACAAVDDTALEARTSTLQMMEFSVRMVVLSAGSAFNTMQAGTRSRNLSIGTAGFDAMRVPLRGPPAERTLVYDMPSHPVYLEIGSRRTFAYAVDWPGWCRHGRDPDAALAHLLEYAPRYARIVNPAKLGFEPPSRIEELKVIAKLKGDTTTDFGAPGIVPEFDHEPASARDHKRFEKLVRAGWRALDRSAKSAERKELTKGPRGGGRELGAILEHVSNAERGYLSAFGWKTPPPSKMQDPVKEIRAAVIDALRASSRGEIPREGPKRGKRWPVRYYVRRSVWHVIAHAWEIERRAVPVT